MSKFRKSLQNPFLLVGQGFIVGALLFLATHQRPADGAAAAATAESSLVERLLAIF